MAPSPDSPLENPRILLLAGVVFLACILAASFLLGGASPSGPASCPAVSSHEPVFVDPVEKLKQVRDPAYTQQLFSEAVAYEPLLATPGTQVHMGFYSAKGNHGSLLRLLDTVNEGPAAKADPPNRAIWAMGINGYYPYPSWERMMNEHWYERAFPVNGSVMIFGKSYRDPYPVTFEQADAIWAGYSERFAMMAEPVAKATGKPVKVWCFVEGAKADRIFYTIELPALKKLEDQGLVEIYFAKSQDAEWNNMTDWIKGSANTPAPAASS
jgi:hypothetical protein